MFFPFRVLPPHRQTWSLLFYGPLVKCYESDTNSLRLYIFFRPIVFKSWWRMLLCQGSVRYVWAFKVIFDDLWETRDIDFNTLSFCVAHHVTILNVWIFKNERGFLILTPDRCDVAVDQLWRHRLHRVLRHPSWDGRSRFTHPIPLGKKKIAPSANFMNFVPSLCWKAKMYTCLFFCLFLYPDSWTTCRRRSC